MVQIVTCNLWWWPCYLLLLKYDKIFDTTGFELLLKPNTRSEAANMKKLNRDLLFIAYSLSSRAWILMNIVLLFHGIFFKLQFRASIPRVVNKSQRYQYIRPEKIAIFPGLNSLNSDFLEHMSYSSGPYKHVPKPINSPKKSCPHAFFHLIRFEIFLQKCIFTSGPHRYSGH